MASLTMSPAPPTHKELHPIMDTHVVRIITEDGLFVKSEHVSEDNMWDVFTEWEEGLTEGHCLCLYNGTTFDVVAEVSK